MEIFFPKSLWSRWLGPFLLLYGPLFYLGLQCIKGIHISLRVAVLHVVPFLLFLGWFILLKTEIISSDLNSQSSFSSKHYLAGALSFLSYALFSINVERQILRNKISYNVLIIASGRIVLFFLGILMLIIVIFYFQHVILRALKIVAFFCQLVLTCLIYYSLMSHLKEVSVMEYPDQENSNEGGAVDKYEKSMLTDEQLVNYANRLNNAVDNDRIFLDPRLSLSSLAAYLKMPNHHLTQLFSRKENQTFHEYINKRRVAYACQLLKENPTAGLGSIAEQSGFNSKPSFNRQFKSIMRCSPSEYRNRYL